MGTYTGDATTTGANNVAVGYNAFGTNTESSENVAVGSHALNAQNGGSANVGVGHYALAVLTTAAENTSCGYSAGRWVTTGASNSHFGLYAGLNVTTGTYNVLLGRGAGSNITTGSNNICIGTATGSAVGAANNIVLGYGIAGPGDNVVAFGKASNVIQNTFTSNATWSQASDERLKTDITDNTLGLDFINEMETKTYRWKPSYDVPEELTNHYNEENQKDTEVLMYGMMAQKVKASMDKHENPEFTGWEENKDGSQNLSREMFVIPLIKAVQELSTQINELKDEIKLLKGE